MGHSKHQTEEAPER